MGARDDRKVTPGITELSRLRAHISRSAMNFWKSISTARLATSMSAFPILVVQNISGNEVSLNAQNSLNSVGDQGWGCSPIKRDHELGSERCEAVCLLSTGNVGI